MKSVFRGFKYKGFKHFGCKTETCRSLCQSEETKKKAENERFSAAAANLISGETPIATKPSGLRQRTSPVFKILVRLRKST